MDINSITNASFSRSDPIFCPCCSGILAGATWGGVLTHVVYCMGGRATARHDPVAALRKVISSAFPLIPDSDLSKFCADFVAGRVSVHPHGAAVSAGAARAPAAAPTRGAPVLQRNQRSEATADQLLVEPSSFTLPPIQHRLPPPPLPKNNRPPPPPPPPPSQPPAPAPAPRMPPPPPPPPPMNRSQQNLQHVQYTQNSQPLPPPALPLPPPPDHVSAPTVTLPALSTDQFTFLPTREITGTQSICAQVTQDSQIDALLMPASPLVLEHHEDSYLPSLPPILFEPQDSLSPPPLPPPLPPQQSQPLQTWQVAEEFPSLSQRERDITQLRSNILANQTVQAKNSLPDLMKPFVDYLHNNTTVQNRTQILEKIDLGQQAISGFLDALLSSVNDPSVQLPTLQLNQQTNDIIQSPVLQAPFTSEHPTITLTTATLPNLQTQRTTSPAPRRRRGPNPPPPTLTSFFNQNGQFDATNDPEERERRERASLVLQPVVRIVDMDIQPRFHLLSNSELKACYVKNSKATPTMFIPWSRLGRTDHARAAAARSSLTNAARAAANRAAVGGPGALYRRTIHAPPHICVDAQTLSKTLKHVGVHIQNHHETEFERILTGASFCPEDLHTQMKNNGCTLQKSVLRHLLGTSGAFLSTHTVAGRVKAHDTLSESLQSSVAGSDVPTQQFTTIPAQVVPQLSFYDTGGLDDVNPNAEFIFDSDYMPSHENSFDWDGPGDEEMEDRQTTDDDEEETAAVREAYQPVAPPDLDNRRTLSRPPLPPPPPPRAAATSSTAAHYKFMRSQQIGI